MKRREFLLTTSGTFAAAIVPFQSSAQTRPCPPGTVAVAGGPTLDSVCGPSSPPLRLPKYLSGMLDFEVRHLVGDFAPGNGAGVTLQDVQPAEYKAVDAPSGLKGVIDAWSGGAQDAANRRLLFSGGGHSVSVNNGLMVYDFRESDDRPVGWSIAPNSQCTVAEGSAAAAGGSTVVATNRGNMPPSLYTYDWQRFAPNSARFYRISGGDIRNQQRPQSLWYYQFPNGPWVDVGAINGDNNILNLISMSGGPQGATAVISPDETLYLLICTVAPSYFVDTTTGAVQAARIMEVVAPNRRSFSRFWLRTLVLHEQVPIRTSVDICPLPITQPGTSSSRS